MMPSGPANLYWAAPGVGAFLRVSLATRAPRMARQHPRRSTPDLRAGDARGQLLTMSKLFRASHRALQQQFDTERLADRIEERLFREQLDADHKAFIERMDMFFLATADSTGRPSCSYKGGDPGFVRVIDPETLAFPCYDGNGMFLSMGT